MRQFIETVVYERGGREDSILNLSQLLPGIVRQFATLGEELKEKNA